MSVILLGDKQFFDNNEYQTHNSHIHNVYVIYDDLKKINKHIDYTFNNVSDAIDIDILKRNVHIINLAYANIVFSATGARSLSEIIPINFPSFSTGNLL